MTSRPELDVDLRGVPTHECLNCGCRMFKVLVQFEDYDVTWWSLNGYCAGCGLPVTVPCPSDRPY